MNDDIDQQRFTMMYEANYNAVANYVKRRAPEVDIPAVVHDVFFTAWRRLRDVPEHAQLPWLLKTAQMTLANGFRGNGNRQQRERHAGSTGPPQGHDPAEVAVGRLAVHEALGALDDKDRIILEMIVFDDYTVAEAAKALGLNRTTVAMRLLRLRKLWPSDSRRVHDDAGVHPLVRLLGRRPHA